MKTKKNRIHRACANVDGNLNYTKFNHFAPYEVAESGRAKARKPDLESSPQRNPRRSTAPIVENRLNSIAEHPLAPARCGSNRDRAAASARFSGSSGSRSCGASL